MKKLIAVASGDWHLNWWAEFNEGGRRTQATMEIIKFLTDRASKLKVPLLFTGDLFHTPAGIHYKVMDLLPLLLWYFSWCKTYAITGNHDQGETNTNEHKSPSMIDLMSRLIPEKFQCIDNDMRGTPEFNIVGVPYHSRNIGFKESLKKAQKYKSDKKTILLIHSTLPGSKDPNGMEFDKMEGISRKDYIEIFKPFDLVLSGHIHKFKKLSEKVYMVGAPNQQRRSDSGCVMGYVEIYDDMSVRFKTIKTRKFKAIPDSGEVDDYHYWFKDSSPDHSEETEDMVEFSKDDSRETLAISYCKATGVKDKKKISALKNILIKN